ncbi:hypothetical protein O181_019283 [Austropuccinia psidii MF-1]|uniref:Uncharacterized protein n=1 Tax=Austropuccinia psidii MF-1 TaxID=1389203 RepID=A0A9Q3C9D3_9BASI|nr:hypothetical protein [Austropuccinia psidii MF-1]
MEDLIDKLMVVPLNQPMTHLTAKQHNWHHILQHPTDQVLKSLGLNHNDEDPCELCVKERITLLPFKGHFPKVQKLIECIHLDLVGPISPPLASGQQYF